MPLAEIVKGMDLSKLKAIDDLTVIFVSDPYDNSATSFLNYAKLNHLMPKNTLIVKVVVNDFPFVREQNRYELETLIDGYYNLTLHYGFMQTINVPRSLEIGIKSKLFPFPLDVRSATFLVEIIHFAVGKKKYPRFFNWQKRLFSLLLRNSQLSIEFFHLPPAQTISIGSYL